MNKDKNSQYIIGFVTFVGDCSRGILFPALWPICNLVGGNRIVMGYLVSCFSIGRLFVATPLGLLSDYFKHKLALIISSIILLIGSIIWANVVFLGGIYSLFIAQILLGLGTGSLGVTRSYIVEQTKPSERTNALAWLSAIQYAGFAGTPIIGSLLISVGSIESASFSLSLPAYLLAFLTFVSLLFLTLVFKNIPDISPDNPRKSDEVRLYTMEKIEPLKLTENQKDEYKDKFLSDYKVEMIEEPISAHNLCNDEEFLLKNQKENYFIINRSEQFAKNLVFFLMIAVNLSTRGAIAIYETNISRLLTDFYHQSELVIGTFISLAGLLGVIQLLMFKSIWSSRFSDATLILCASSLSGLFQTLVIINSNPLWSVVSSIFVLYSVGYPVANTAALGCFSKLKQSGKQGLSQSLFALFGSLARVVFPVISVYLEQSWTKNASFRLVGLLMAITSIAVALSSQPIAHFCESKELMDSTTFEWKMSLSIKHSIFITFAFINILVLLIVP